MKTPLSRPWLLPVLLLGLLVVVTLPATRAVDPIDFLESLKDDEDLQPRDSSSSTEYPNGVNVIPGEPDVNYPVYSSIPKSSFSCIGRPVGFYADTELRCQVWHICDEDRRQQSFLCTNGTVYSQEKRVCDWWYNVNCDPNEVSKNYLQNYDLYKGPPPKSENEQEENNQSGSNKDNNGNSNNNKKDFDYQSSSKPDNNRYNNDPFSQFAASRQKSAESQQKPRFDVNNDQQYSKPTPSYNEQSRDSSNNNDFPTPRRNPPPPPRQTTTTTTTYRPPTTYATPLPPAALQGSSFPPKPPQHQRPHQPQQQQKQHQQPPVPGRTQPSIKTTNQNGKRIVEIRVPISQIPPEILAKYGKRIPENILKEIFLNFTRGQQQQLQQEAITNAKPNNPTGANNNRSPPPSAPIPQSRPQHHHQQQQQPAKKPVDFGGNVNNNKPASFNSGNSKSSTPTPPPPPPPPAEPQQKFRHSTPRKVDNVKFAAPTRELLAEYDDERQQVGESLNPIYSLQQLFSSQHSRTSAKSKNFPSANEVPRVKESFNYEEPSTTTSLPAQPYQEFTRAQPRRRTQAPVSTPRTTTTTSEPELITDRYFPVATPEEKRNAEIKRIFLVAKQGIKVLPPIPVLSGAAEELPTARRQPPPFPVTQRPRQKLIRTTAIPDFSKIPPPPPKVSIPDDYYVQNERFQEAESRYPRPSVPSPYIEPQFQTREREYSRPTTTSAPRTTTTTTTTPPPPPSPTPFYRDVEFTRRPKPTKQPPQNKKKPLPPVEDKKQEDSSDYDEAQDEVNKEELELLRLAQEYIELTGQEFGARKAPRNA